MYWYLELLPENTESSAWNPVRSKIKLFTKVINGLKAFTYKVHKKNVYIFKIKIIATCLTVFYCYSGVAPITKTQTHTKNYHTEEMAAPKSIEMCTVKLLA